MDKVTRLFDKGTHNLIDSEIIPDGAAKDSKNFVNKDGRVVLVGGRNYFGDEGDFGAITGLHVGYKVNGDKIVYRKAGTDVEYYGTTDLTDNLILNMPMNEGTGTSLIDYSSNFYTGTVSGATWSGDELEFNGIDDYVEIDDNHISEKEYDFTALDTAPVGMFFKPDGLSAYVIGYGSDTVYQLTLGTAWDITTASSAAKSKDVSAEDSDPWGLFIKSDGTKMYVGGITNDYIYQYTMSTPWDMSTATYDTVSVDVSAAGLNPTGLWFKDDGTKMYVLSSSSDAIYQYTLSTPWVVSSATYDTVTVSSSDTDPRGVCFNPTGTLMYVSGRSGDGFRIFELSTAWDLSTAVYGDYQFIRVTGSANCSITLSADGYNFYGTDSGTGKILQRTVTTPYRFWNTAYQNGFSLSAWIRPDTIGESAGRIIDKSNNSNVAGGFAMYMQANKVGIKINAGTEIESATNSVIIGDSNWYHVVSTVDSSGIATMYVNGVQSGTPGFTEDVNNININNNTRIGGRSLVTDRTFEGGIKGAVIHNKALSALEVAGLYANDSATDTGIQAWQTSITGLGEDTEVTFANYSSLAGSFTYMNCEDAYYKIINSHPADPIDVYDSNKNFKGYILIDKGRTILWNRDKDKTGLYGSKIDSQDSTVYTAVTGEELGNSGSTTYIGTLAFNSGNIMRSCHGVTLTGVVAAGLETFTDDFNGNLTSNFGGTGTINYSTGEYIVNFSDITIAATQTVATIEFVDNGAGSDYMTDSGSGFIAAGFARYQNVKIDGSASNDQTIQIKQAVQAGQLTFDTGVFTNEAAGASVTTTAVILADYQWENSAYGGVADFSKSSPRQAAEGFQFPQDEGGDAILSVQVGQDGAYYSLKENSCYRLTLDVTDTEADNEIYRKDMGLPYFRSAISTNRGIMFVNTVNPTQPKVTILQKNKVSLDVEPVVLFPHFNFNDYTFDNASFASYDRWTLIFCKSAGAVNNDTILMCNISEKTVNVVSYTGTMAVQYDSRLLVGDSLTKAVISTFDEFDDLELAIEAYWEGKRDILGTEDLKKVRRIRVKGSIDPDQSVNVYMDIDSEGYSLVGAISGDGSYVNYNEAQAIGANFIGEDQVGGADVVNAYGYYVELKLRSGKFRNISIKFVPTGIGYFDFNLINLWDIMTFESRIPKSYRTKQ